MMRLSSISLLLACFALQYASAGRFVCYFPNWSFNRAEPWQFGVEQIDPNLCTHLVYSFAVLDETTFQIASSDPAVDIDQEFFKKFNDLKNQNQNLKTMLAVGGWGDSNINDKYSQLVASAENINTFVASAVQYLTQYGFDGLDMDWEYPRTDADRTGFINLLKALKDAFAPHGFILSAAVGSVAENLGYDIPAIDATVDFINLMTYDFHGSWEPESADHHAPLKRRPWDTNNYNVEDGVNYWIQNGLTASKINLGIPLYGRSWKLSSGATNPPAPASGAGAPGPFTGEEGYLSYFEICSAVMNDGWQVYQDPEQLNGPYALSPTNVVEWVGYDDVAMVTTKSNYVLAKGLGGAMVWEVSLDDFRGTCGGVNPLLSAISKIVLA